MPIKKKKKLPSWDVRWKREAVFIGALLVGDGKKIDVTDPCYGRDVDCRINDIKVDPGMYGCFVVERDKSIVSIAIANSVVDKSGLPFMRKLLGSVGCDSGSVGFFISPKENKATEGQTGNFSLTSTSFFGANGGECTSQAFGHKGKYGKYDALRLDIMETD